MDARCAEMLARVICDVEESGRAEERAREWQRSLDAERTKARDEREQTLALAAERDREREAEMDQAYERNTQNAKGKGKEQSLNSPPASMKGARPKGRLNRSRSLLMALVSTFSNPSSSSPPPASVPATPSSAPATRSCFANTAPRSSSPLRAFARRASISALSSISRGESTSESNEAAPSPNSASSVASVERPPSPSSIPPHNLETPPASAPPSAPSSAFSRQQSQSAKALTSLLGPRSQEMTPRALRRRARSTLVDAFRAHVLPELGGRVGLFEAAGSSPLRLRVVPGDDQVVVPSAGGGGYHAWVARSMLRRAEARMRELEDTWPTLTSPTSRRSHSLSADSQSPTSPSYRSFSPASVPVPVSPISPTHPRHATFEPWSSDESETDEDTVSDGEFEGGSEGDSECTDTDGSSVHTPESRHSIGYGRGHVQETSSSSTSSYFTCSDVAEADEPDCLASASHIRRAAQSSPAPAHSRTPSAVASHPRRPSSSNSAPRRMKKELRERKRVQRAAKAEHIAFARMTARLRQLLTHSATTRGMVRLQKEETDRLREYRAVRRGWLDGGKEAMGSSFSGIKNAEVFRPSGLGRWEWAAENFFDEEETVSDLALTPEDRPPAYEDVVSQTDRFVAHGVHRTRAKQPIHRTRTTLVQLDDLDLEVDLEQLEIEPADLDALDIDVDLERLDLTNSLDVDAMGLDIDVDGDMAFRHVDVFADVTGKVRTKAKARRATHGSGRREAWERRRMVPI